jgi:hypothetical protein
LAIAGVNHQTAILTVAIDDSDKVERTSLVRRSERPKAILAKDQMDLARR